MVDGSESCSKKFEDAETLFTYDWPGMKPFYSKGYDHENDREEYTIK